MTLEFDGTNDAVSLANFDVSSGNDELTIMSWVQLKASEDDRVISKANGTAVNDHWWCLHTPNTTLSVRLKTTGSTVQIQGGSLTLNKWAHAAFIYNGATLRLLKDGSQVNSTSLTGNVAQNAGVGVRIADNPVGDRFFDGCLEDIRIYDRAVTDDELRTIIALGGLDKITNGLVHRWKLVGQDGQTASGAGSVKDSAGTQDGTPVDSPVYRGTILKTRKRVA